VLRRFQTENHDGFVEMNRDSRVMKYFPELLSSAESLSGIARIEQHWETYGFGPWALDVCGEFAGLLGLKVVPTEMPFAPAVELLYRLLPRFWGQGLATDGSLAALEFGFRKLNLERIVAFAVETNIASVRVMVKLGMGYCYDFDHPLISESSPLRKHVLYQLDRADWHPIQSSAIQVRA